MGAAALELAPEAWAAKVLPLKTFLEEQVCKVIAGVQINGQGVPRVANTINLNFQGVEGDGLVMALDLKGYSVSSGSACASGVLEPSHVLLAMGRSHAQAMAAVRVSLTDSLSRDDLIGFVEALQSTVERIRNVAARTKNPPEIGL